ncbi:ABC transporter substrate-binding protein [Fusibacter sp. 3D3]|uniref:ABC transporter substrate-binding protein n=1 Tax=Fusibacter sp. 3D3 TaxID=1048380 RepID=UPI000853A800|nr:ABC transporter substrate-binding protein [Fusibacter sp. 3D3]GAU77271.1 branched-chain amino acid ABC transporter, amino acid-binding protein [Fusibacter sp. 3D3]
MKTKKMSFIIIAILLIIAIGYPYNKRQNNPIQIGFVSALSGPSADLGFACRNALEMYIDEVNSNGGIHGRPIEILILDDQGNPEIALTHFEKLIADGVQLIVGQVTSASATLTVPYVNEHHALFISPLVSSNAYRGQDDHFIALAPSASDQGNTISNYIISQKKSSRVAILYDQSNFVYSNAVIEGAIEPFTQTEHFEFQLYALNESSEIPAVINAASEFVPDDFIVITNVSDLLLISNQVKKTLGNIDIYSSMWGMAPEVISGYGESMANVYGVYAINPNSDSPQYLDFKTRYLEKYQVEANFGAIYTYNAAYLLTTAIKNVNSTDPDIINTYIKDTQFFDGINTPYEITSTGDAVRKLFIIHAEDGKTIN